MKFIREHWLPLILLAALLVRLPQLRLPLWNDEAFVWTVSGLPASSWWTALAGDVHPPLFYAVEYAVSQVSREPWALRLFPTLCGLVLVVLAARLAGALGAPVPARVGAALIVAFAPQQIYYSAEVRMYSLLAALYLAGALCVYRRRWGLMALCLLGLMLTHHYGFFYCASLGLLALCLQKGDWRKILVCSGWALLAYLPMLPMTLYQFQQTKSYWSQFSMYGLVVTIATWFSGWTIDAPGVGAALIVCSLALLFAAVVRSVLRRDYAVLWLTFAPLLMVLAICPFKNVYMGRALLGCAASCCVLFAVEFTRSIRSQSLAVALVGLVLAVGVVTDRTRETVISRYASPTVAEYLRANARPGDVVRCYGSAVYMELQPYRLPVATWLDQSDDLLPFGGLSTMTISALQGGTIPPGREWIYTMRLPGFAPVIAPGARLVGAWTGAEKTFKSELYLQEETAWQH